AQCRFESDWGHRFCRLSYPSVPYKVVHLRAAGMAPVMQQDVSYLARRPPDHTDKGAGWGAGKKLLVVPPGPEQASQSGPTERAIRSSRVAVTSCCDSPG